jgi:hypothetical protein
MAFKARSPSAGDAAQGLVRGNPIFLSIQERGLDPAPIVDAVTAKLAERGGDRPMELPMKAWVVTAVAR